MAKSKIIKGLVILFMAGYLIASCFALKVNAEDITTGNLLPNEGDGVDWGSSSTEQINPGSSGWVSNGDVVNGFTITCPASQANCGYKFSVGGDFEVTGTATVTVDDLALTNSSRTQDMLDNGITLNNYIDIANCDSEAGNCEGDSGDTDSHTITIKIKDSSGTVQSTTTQTRTNIVGFKGNCNGYPSSSLAGVSAACGQYNNTVIFNSTGANKLDWAWSGTDNNTGSASRGGPNLLGAKLTMTYDDTVISTEASTALEYIEEVLEDLQTEVFEDMEEFYFEEEYFSFNEEPEFEMEMEMETTMGEFTFSEEFFEEEIYFEEEFVEEEIIMEEPMEEFYEETNEIVDEFLPMVPEEEEFSSEETFTTETFEEEEIIEEEMTEESTEMAEEETIEEESTEMAEEEVVEEESTEMVEAEDEETFEEEAQEEESSSETTTASAVSSEKVAKQKKIQQKKALVKNLDRIMDKVDRDVKDIAKNLAIKNIIKMAAMTSEQASLELYKNAVFYRPEDIYLRQLNIFDPRQLYPNTSLASYTQNDKIEIKARKLQDINIKKQRLLIELEQLRNG
jgi:hypothetical protein